MKKRISVILLAALLLNVFCIGAMATGTDYSNNLVTHYDFSGATVAEALKDKAPVGTADNLELNAFGSDNVVDDEAKELAKNDYEYDLANGTVKKIAANNSQLKTVNKVSSDYDAIKTSATMLFRFKIDSELYNTSEIAQLLWMRQHSTRQIFDVVYNNSVIVNTIASYQNTQATHGYNSRKGLNVSCTAKDIYINYMVTYSGTENGGVTMTVYTCIGNDFGAWTQAGNPITTTTEVFQPSAGDICARFMGPWSNTDTESTGLEMDDIRIYNTVMTPTALGGELQKDLEAGKLDGVVDYSNNLVTHYDFSGATVTEALKDKAPVGTADNLELTATNPDDLSDITQLVEAAKNDFSYDLENGTVKKVAANHGQLKTINKVSTDYNAINSAATMLFRFKIDSELYDSTATKPNAQLLWMRTWSKLQVLDIVYNNSTIANTLASNSASETSVYRTLHKVDTTCTAMDTYINYMVTYSAAGDGKVTMTVYTCIGDDFSTWTPSGSVTTTGAVYKPNDTALYARFMGPWSTKSADGENLGLEMDDFRLYNTVMTPTALGGELQKDLEAGKLDAGIRVEGIQKNGNNDLRFLALIDDLNADEIGFEITAEYGAQSVFVERTTKTVFTSIIAANEEKVAAELGGTYIAAAVITGVPQDVGDITFTIKAYRLIGGVKEYGATVTYIYVPAGA